MIDRSNDTKTGVDRKGVGSQDQHAPFAGPGHNTGTGSAPSRSTVAFTEIVKTGSASRNRVTPINVG